MHVQHCWICNMVSKSAEKSWQNLIRPKYEFLHSSKKSQNCRANLTYIITAIRALTDTAITKIITATTHLIVMVTKSFLKLVIQFLKKTKIFSKYEKFLLLTGSEVATTNKFISLLFSALNTICMQHFYISPPPIFFLQFLQRLCWSIKTRSWLWEKKSPMCHKRIFLPLYLSSYFTRVSPFLNTFIITL